jgi:hypothetical protein
MLKFPGQLLDFSETPFGDSPFGDDPFGDTLTYGTVYLIVTEI